MEGLAAVVLGVTLAPKQAFASVDEITQEEISRYMSMNTVEEILGDSVKYITPGEWDSAIKESKKEGVLVFVYSDKNDNSPSTREAIIIRHLAEKYSRKIEILACRAEKSLYNNYGIEAAPSMTIYARFDLLKGETPQNNDGKLKLVDLIKGGPKKDGSIITWFDFLSNEWIPTNLTSPNGSYVWRFNNSWDEKKIGYGN